MTKHFYNTCRYIVHCRQIRRHANSTFRCHFRYWEFMQFYIVFSHSQINLLSSKEQIITVTVLDIICRPVFYSSTTFRRLDSVSVFTWDLLRWGSIDRASLCLRRILRQRLSVEPNWIGSTWRRGLNPLYERNETYRMIFTFVPCRSSAPWFLDILRLLGWKQDVPPKRP
jgi:hypothetical protein